MSYVASQYAEALFGMALEDDSTDKIFDLLLDFSKVFDEDINKFLNHPKISNKDKKTVIDDTVTNKLLKHFIYVLIDNHRIDLLQDIVYELQKIVDNQNKIMKVQVFSNSILDSEQMKQLIQNLNRKQNREIKLENIVDLTIVGGLRIEYEGMVLDDTINNYLNNLKANLTK
jgi:F-type H+-transporting ATPase subunit delta